MLQKTDPDKLWKKLKCKMFIFLEEKTMQRRYLKRITAGLICTATLASYAAAPAGVLVPEFISTVSAGSNNCTWVIEDGVFTISGIGEMPYILNASDAPWNSQKNEIKKVIIEKGITNISSYAFANCPNLESVVIPDTVTLIRNSAFSNDRNLKSIDIPSSVKEIWSRAFSNTGCTEIVIPDSATELDGAIVADSIYLKKVVLPKNLTTIPSVMFSGCSALEDIDIPESVTMIDYYAFSGCSSLQTVALPSGLKTIEYNSFEQCLGLKNIEIPASVETVGECAFQGCSALESIKITNSATSVGSGAFSDCASLKTADVPADLEFAPNAFLNDMALTDAPFSFQLTGGTEWGYNTSDKITWTLSSDGTLSISGTTRMREGEKTASFTTGWNRDSKIRDAVKKIVINEGVQSVAIRGFEYFNNLEEVVLPSTVKKVCRSAFSNCPNLKKINFPEGLTQIDMFAFYGDESLETIDLPSTLESLGEASFYCCRPVKKIIIPENITVIPKDCFAGCNSLEELTLPDGLRSIEFQAFTHLDIKKIEIPDTVTSIAKNAFIGCDLMEEVVISDQSQLTSIGENAFYECSALKSFSFPDGVTTVESGVLAYCSSLSEVDLNKVEVIKSKDENESTTSPFAFCGNLKKLYIPMSVKSIQKDSFYSNKNLKTVIYCGTQDDWDKISIGENNAQLNKYPQYHEYVDGTCVYCGHKTVKAKVEGMSASVGGNISLNVFVSFEGDIENDDSAYVHFVLPNQEQKDIYVKSVEPQQNGFYKFTVDIPAQYMSGNIHGDIIVSNGTVIKSFDTSVEEYAHAVAVEEEYEEFIDAMIDYGTYAKAYFQGDSEDPKNYTEEDFQNVASQITPSEGIKDSDYIGSSLLLKSNTVLRHYFSEYKPGRTEKDGMYYIEQSFAPGAYSQKIDGFDYNIYDYIYIVVSDPTEDPALRKLCASLFEYGKAAEKLN